MHKVGDRIVLAADARVWNYRDAAGTFNPDGVVRKPTGEYTVLSSIGPAYDPVRGEQVEAFRARDFQGTLWYVGAESRHLIVRVRPDDWKGGYEPGLHAWRWFGGSRWAYAPENDFSKGKHAIRIGWGRGHAHYWTKENLHYLPVKPLATINDVLNQIDENVAYKETAYSLIDDPPSWGVNFKLDERYCDFYDRMEE